MFETIQPYLENIITLLLGGFLGWFPNRKKEAITNQQSIVDLYQDSLTDLKTRYEEKYQDLKTQYEEKFQQLKQTFEGKLDGFSTKIEALEKSLGEWKKKYFNLKKDFDNYKKEHP